MVRTGPDAGGHRFMNLDPPLLPSALGDQGDGHPMPAVPCPRVPIANPGLAPAVGIPSIGVPTANLGWQLFRTTAAQVVGRNFTSAARLVVAAIIFRSYGKDLFGAYALIL